MLTEQLNTYFWAVLYICAAAACLGLIIFLVRWCMQGRPPTSRTSPQKPTASAKETGTALAWLQVFKD